KVDFRDPKARKTVLIVDEHPIVRRGVRAFIELLSGYTIIGEVDGGAGAIAAAVARAPDIVVMDLPWPRASPESKRFGRYSMQPRPCASWSSRFTAASGCCGKRWKRVRWATSARRRASILCRPSRPWLGAIGMSLRASAILFSRWMRRGTPAG
ncbi:MAG TPA: response regulator, partial [Croceibacterium sp.]|nr:response regulator [Croceibacterium sp.]